ncbi:MAG: Nif3-like dinuclear metal center hexameric protein [Cyclobacteriaceae bacterium]|nr:Nif3-like dinuclear metal center hexameric protein [Cyclobacteriaceae bacterium]
MTKVSDITQYIESLAPLSLQESYDNAGLITGDSEQMVSGVLICLDVTTEILDEAIQLNCNFILAHHPIIFKGLKKITGKHYVERIIIKAIKHDIAIYACHTNLDNVSDGVNRKLAEVIGLESPWILSPKPHQLCKLTTFIPEEHTEEVLDALHQAGAGEVGNYKGCSFKLKGQGTFTPNELANPHIGQKNMREEVTEDRIEVIFPVWQQKQVMLALRNTHPYEEIAYYLHSLENENQLSGSGMIGKLNAPMDEPAFIEHLKEKLELKIVRHTAFTSKKIQTVALCGGSGSFLIGAAIANQADAFVTADVKYHDFFEADGKLLLADVGHYESERFTKDLFYKFLSENFSNIALHLSMVNTNPIFYT